MPTDSLARLRNGVGARVAEIREQGPRLSPLDMHSRMDAICQLGALNGLVALEASASRSAQLALLPGHRVAVDSSLDNV